MARHIIKHAFARAGIEDDGRFGTHTLRKTCARKVYEASGHDFLVVGARHRFGSRVWSGEISSGWRST